MNFKTRRKLRIKNTYSIFMPSLFDVPFSSVLGARNIGGIDFDVAKFTL